MFSWKTFAVMSLLGIACALDTAVDVDFDTDIVFDPPEAWHKQFSSVCLTNDYYTNQPNASASLIFTGNRVLVYGLRNNASGSFSFAVDGATPRSYKLQSAQVQCELFVDDYLEYGTHNLTLMLEPADVDYIVSEGGTVGSNPVLHLTKIMYYTPQSLPSSSPSSSPSSLLLSSTHKGAIVGGVVGGVVLLSVIIAAFIFAVKKQKGPFRRGRHLFDPTRPNTTLDITELSPRSPRSGGFDDSMKFPASYARMEDDAVDVKTAGDDHGKSDTLTVPTLAYASANGDRGGKSGAGMRSRSRSPMPARERDA